MSFIFTRHPEIEGLHAFLSPSKYHWINYDPPKLVDTYAKYQAAQRGTELHKLAADCIRLGQRLPKSKKTMSAYVNDALSFRMTTEQPLKYSNNCFGTTDAISFENNFLRIHDLKTGTTPAHMEQLLIYAALFCLEYHRNPVDIQTELRIYQNDEITYYCPSSDELSAIMNTAVESNKIVDQLKLGVY